MSVVKESVRCYRSQIHMNHAAGALKRFGWRILSAQLEDTDAGKKVWTIRATKGWTWVLKVFQAIEAAKAAYRHAMGLPTPAAPSKAKKARKRAA